MQKAGVSSRASYQDPKSKRKVKDLQVPDSQHFIWHPKDAFQLWMDFFSWWITPSLPLVSFLSGGFGFAHGLWLQAGSSKNRGECVCGYVLWEYLALEHWQLCNMCWRTLAYMNLHSQIQLAKILWLHAIASRCKANSASQWMERPGALVHS